MPPELLNPLDQRILKEAFRQAQRLQRKLASELSIIMGLFRTTLHWPPPAPETLWKNSPGASSIPKPAALDTMRDRVLSLGAFDVSMAGIVLNRRFEAVLKIDIPLNEHNILIHRLTPQQLTRAGNCGDL
ncbi:MAG: hypothetical protein IPM37_03520 [Hahellaceae bacterium]|nr:hypothetical protein [Hahellaceae bacterium]